MNYPLCHSAIGSIVSLDNCTPDTGYEPNVMELTGTTELNNAASSDIYFQDSLDYTALLSDPYIDDDELGKLLAVVVDRTGQPVSERSDSDHFPCSVRNVKSAQNQFPVITQAQRMVDRTGKPVEERIAEERESSSAQIRTLLNEQRKTIIAEYCEKVSHHELLAAQAEQEPGQLHTRHRMCGLFTNTCIPCRLPRSIARADQTGLIVESGRIRGMSCACFGSFGLRKLSTWCKQNRLTCPALGHVII